MISRAAIALMSRPAQDAISEWSRRYDNITKGAIVAEEVCRIAQRAQMLYPKLVRHPEPNKRAIKVFLFEFAPKSPDIYVYCCVRSFNLVKPVISLFEEFGYKLSKRITDCQYSMSRTFQIEKGKYPHPIIYIKAFALEELGADCKVVEIGYIAGSPGKPEFRLVCDELEEKALKQQDPLWAL